ncbi:hypothetical protein VMCG_03254 [Cytospora schulzeri]|uniref:Ent-kaurene synthase n=1 Tax=Cytospora schulzeri TaxID=448051 RepID=A0A423WY98_9PEZI|nr:hypothetical protein VMCG_03254 [Valsa malicola]
MNGQDKLNTEAILLLQRAVEGFDDKYGTGSMSCAVYDTAWLSLITKVIDGKKEWLFPQCFSYILDTQSDDGSWGLDTRCQIDGILNTAASLLTLKRHISEPLNTHTSSHHASREDLQKRVDSATASLRSQLKEWDVSATVHVGFEIIVPALLRYLQQEDSTLVFEFPGRNVLETINQAKLARFQAEFLYGPTKSTALHSLEVFVGMIDFDRVVHHKTQGSMMASPASTAAYLMNLSWWDDEAEEYLRHVIEFGAGKASGGVPSAYPSTHFEYTWILSTMLRSGFSSSSLDCPASRKMTQVLAQAFEDGDGVIGFAPFVGADVDDTAKGIVSMAFLGQPVKPEKMIMDFETETHFRTYAKERDPSFSANCNALSALLCQPDVSQYSSQIVKIVQYLCNHWWNSDGKTKDKWNLCHLYPSLLLVETMVDLMVLIDEGNITCHLSQELQSKMLITLFQACLRPLLEQRDDGSWDNSIEATAYGVLILCEARRLSMFADLRQPLESAIDLGVAYIQSLPVTTSVPMWIEKVSYGSVVLTDCYVLAALKASMSSPASSLVGASLFKSTQSVSGRKHVKLFQQTPLFAPFPEWQIQASMVESVLFQPLLRARRLSIFPRTDMEDDKYFDIIPFSWTSCNNRTRTWICNSFIYEMMVISFLNYQADEFMEATAGEVFYGQTDALRRLIDDAFSMDSNELQSLNGKGRGTNGSGVAEVSLPLSRFVEHISNHPCVLAASSWDRESVKRELRTFLHAHVTQSEDNARFQQGKQNHASTQRQAGTAVANTSTFDSFFHWVRTTSADHTSCPYSFSFVGCLLSALLVQGRESFPTVQEKYLASATCRHLATMCRMYNDYGSIVRDAEEGNVNSINFPEYQSFTNPGADTDTKSSMDLKKQALFDLAEYERACLDDALRRLASLPRETGDVVVDNAKDRQMTIWRMFCDVTDLYGQIYVVRDIASRMVFSRAYGNRMCNKVEGSDYVTTCVA